MATATIEMNVRAWLKHHNILGVVIMEGETRPDRVFCWDTHGALLKHCVARKGRWTRDSGQNHGASARVSFRERASPSLQVCVHEISELSPTARDVCFLELDFDHENPRRGFVPLLVHGAEVIVNDLTQGTTDQTDIARQLSRRGILVEA